MKVKTRKMNRFGLLLCLSTYLLVGTDAALDAEGIVGGEIASPDEYSYQISLEKGGKRFCGGSIIGDRHILTAAHCVTNKSARFTSFTKTVVAGVFDLDNKGPDAVSIEVEKVYIPKEYGENGNIGDIAVLKLAKPLGLDDNEKLSKLELPEEGKTYAGEEATITGYGLTWVKLHTDYTGKKYEKGGADTLKKKFAVTDVVSNAECGRAYFRLISSKQICARVHQRTDKNEGVCSGDSGGPLVYDDNVVIGTVSTSPLGCSERKAPALYTRVSAYLDFIKNAMADRVTDDMKVYEHFSALRPIRSPTASSTRKPWYSFLPFIRDQA